MEIIICLKIHSQTNFAAKLQRLRVDTYNFICFFFTQSKFVLTQMDIFRGIY